MICLGVCFFHLLLLCKRSSCSRGGRRGKKERCFSEPLLCNGFFFRILMKSLQQGGYKWFSLEQLSAKVSLSK